jgi:hypothetical protein
VSCDRAGALILGCGHRARREISIIAAKMVEATFVEV